jgi:nickel-dependent lactate racemase
MIADPKATWGITEGNPIWEEMLEVGLKTSPDFLLNVTLNAQQKITGVFAGDLQAAHRAGCEFLRQSAMVRVDHLYDIVLTTNSGYPLDQNLYQSVKGISAARQIVREGGAIIIATACQDGLPDFGLYARLLAQTDDPSVLLEWIQNQAETVPEQWQVQVQALIQLFAKVYVFSGGLDDKQIQSALFTSTRDISATIAELKTIYGENARICVVPEGPQTIACL